MTRIFLSRKESNAQPGPTLEVLDLPVETSTSYNSRRSVAGTIEPTQEIIGRVYTRSGLGNSACIDLPLCYIVQSIFVAPVVLLYILSIYLMKRIWDLPSP